MRGESGGGGRGKKGGRASAGKRQVGAAVEGRKTFPAEQKGEREREMSKTTSTKQEHQRTKKNSPTTLTPGLNVSDTVWSL